MRLRLAVLGVAALVPLLLAEVQEHEALRFCSDKEASKRDLFKSYWRKCSTEAFNQFGVAELGSAAKIANRRASARARRRHFSTTTTTSPSGRATTTLMIETRE